MTNRVSLSLRIVWIVVAFLILVATLWLYDGTPNCDCEVLLAYGMLVLSFPAVIIVGMIVGYVGRVVYELWGYYATTSYISLTVEWVFLFILGYWQWFIFVPWLVRRLKKPPPNTAG